MVRYVYHILISLSVFLHFLFCTGRPYVPKDCPPSLIALAQQCLATSPEDRPCAEEIVDWLDDLSEQMGRTEDSEFPTIWNNKNEIQEVLVNSVEVDSSFTKKMWRYVKKAFACFGGNRGGDEAGE